MDDWRDMLDAEKHRERAAEAAKEQERKLCAVLAELAATDDGQFFLRWLMDETGAFRQEYPADDRIGMWNAGRRAVGMQVLERCAAAGVADTLLLRKISE